MSVTLELPEKIERELALAWLSEALRQLDGLAGLPADWDGRGSPPVPAAALKSAANLLLWVAGFGLPAPQIFPVAGGGAQFEWQNAKCELELEIRPDGAIEFLIVDAQGEMREGALPPQPFAEIARLADWFQQEKPCVMDL
jgi:hypothetical protein